MKRKLEMDDIREGMYITVLKGKTEQSVFPTPHGPKIRYKEKDHYNGKVLEVIAVDMPYVVVTIHESRGKRNDSLDLRHVEVITLTPKYIHKLLPNLDLRVESFWDEIQDTSLEDADTDIEEIFKDL
ncbi:hypothetical protein LCGC14_2845120 [marine sediment metagenome]|uniref:Uncharacterized protein n=1 Tax=marine sediment metagenome TaxID=412755 RepID=A0A0F8YA50_9ZZZZ